MSEMPETQPMCEECGQPAAAKIHDPSSQWYHEFMKPGTRAARRSSPLSPIDRTYNSRWPTVTPPSPRDEMWARAVEAVRAVPANGERQNRIGQVTAVLDAADRPLSGITVGAIIADATSSNAERIYQAVHNALEAMVKHGRATSERMRVDGLRVVACYSKSATVSAPVSAPVVPIRIAGDAAAIQREIARPHAESSAPTEYDTVLKALEARANKLNAEMLGIQNAIATIRRLREI